MFMVGGGILTHGIPVIYNWIEKLALTGADISVFGGFIHFMTPPVVNLVFGLVAGMIIVLLITMIQRIRTRLAS